MIYCILLALAVLFGILLAIAIKPRYRYEDVDSDMRSYTRSNAFFVPADTLLDLIRYDHLDIYFIVNSQSIVMGKKVISLFYGQIEGVTMYV